MSREKKEMKELINFLEEIDLSMSEALKILYGGYISNCYLSFYNQETDLFEKIYEKSKMIRKLYVLQKQDKDYTK